MYNFKKTDEIDPNKLPIYEISVSDEDETGIQLISLVERPAIGVVGMAFSEIETSFSYEFKSLDGEGEDKMIIVGPALIPDLKIRRKGPDGEYFVMFSKETIEKMVQKFNRYGSNRRINVDHSNRMVDAFVMEDWIIEDPVYDKAKKYGFELPVGTYMVKIKIEDKDFWLNEVRGEGKFGFSIEGLLNQMLVSLENEYNTFDEAFDDLGLIDLCNIFGVYETGCCKTEKVELAVAGLVHPNCKCDLMLGDFEKSAPYIGKNGEPYPCPLCDEAASQWAGRGYFYDVFGTRYTSTDRFPFFVRRKA